MKVNRDRQPVECVASSFYIGGSIDDVIERLKEAKQFAIDKLNAIPDTGYFGLKISLKMLGLVFKLV